MALASTGASPVEPVKGITEAIKDESPKELESTRFTHLAKKESELQRQREEFKREREEILAEKEKLKPIHEKLSKFEELKKTDPVAAIKLLEFSESDLFNFISAQEDTSTPEEKARKAAADEIRKFQEEQSKKEADLTEKQNAQIISDFKDRVSKAMSADKEKYELSNIPGYEKESQELAFEFTKECIQKGEEAPTAQECADHVEEFWKTYWEEKRELMKNIKKLTPQEAAVEAKQKIDQLKAEVSPMPASKTLNNKMTASSASAIDKRSETRDQKRERLMAALRTMKT
ncbi:unnamed protein product [Sphagnum jensenii]